jgi:hypothetical protein
MKTCWVVFARPLHEPRNGADQMSFFNNMADAQNHARKCLEDQLIVSAALVDDKGGHAIHYNQIQEWLVRGI